MSTILDRIIDYKRDEVAALKHEHGISEMLARAAAASAPLGFSAALDRTVESGRNALICEMKRKSPSAGEILPGADPAAIATEYEAGGASCLSVLTDGPSFGGSLDDFRAIRRAVALPLLRKDFMIDPIQIAEARAHGADAILVILSCTEDGLARELIACAHELGMDVLLETHDREEIERALALPDCLIGINNRDLKRMVTDLATTEALCGMIPDGRAFVSESGVHSVDDIQRLRQTGARRFLIGESLMKRADRLAYSEALRDAS